MYLYERLRDLRQDKDLKQTDIAKLLNITQQQYSRYELGIFEIPAHHIITMAKFYHTSVDYILGLTNEKKPYPHKKP